MILLDTNVVSEFRKAKGGKIDPHVRAWADTLGDDPALSISAITLMELRKGVLLKRRHDPRQAAILHHWLEDWVLGAFAGRILPVDEDVALACAPLHIPARRFDLDMLIAATALAHDLTLATRNTRDFAGTGVRLIDPWSYRVGTGSAPE